MSIARSATVAFLGTDETTLATVANSTVSTRVEKDVLGDDTSGGVLHLYAVITSTVTAGSIDIRYNPRRVTTQDYTSRSYQWSITPTNGTQKVYLGPVQATRYASAEANNNATGASATVSILGELYKVS